MPRTGLYGFASFQAGEYFLGTGTLIATVQTLNVSRKLSGTLLGGKVALRLVQAARHWAKARNCEHLLVHVTNGENGEEADRFFRRCGMVTVGGELLGGNLTFVAFSFGCSLCSLSKIALGLWLFLEGAPFLISCSERLSNCGVVLMKQSVRIVG